MRAGKFQTLNLNLLRVFDTLYLERSVTRAALVLGLTQPAVSHALAQLRIELGDALFVRQGAEMAPTALGLELGEQVHRALRGLEAALEPESFDPARSERTFTLATGDNVGTVLAPLILTELLRRAPHTRLQVRPLGGELLKGLDEGEIDAVVNSVSQVPARLLSDELWREAALWVARVGHPALGRRLDGAAMRTLESVEVDLGLARPGASEDGFINQAGLVQWTSSRPGAGRGPRRRATVASFHSAIAMARACDLVTLLPRRLALTLAVDLGLRPLEVEPREAERPLMALWRREHVARPAVAWFRDLLLEVARAPAGPHPG